MSRSLVAFVYLLFQPNKHTHTHMHTTFAIYLLIFGDKFAYLTLIKSNTNKHQFAPSNETDSIFCCENFNWRMLQTVCKVANRRRDGRADCAPSLVKSWRSNAQTGNNNQQQILAQKYLHRHSDFCFVYELVRQCFHYAQPVCGCVCACSCPCERGRERRRTNVWGRVWVWVLPSGKPTNILDEYSTSRTLEKCTCSHCKKSQNRKQGKTDKGKYLLLLARTRITRKTFEEERRKLRDCSAGNSNSTSHPILFHLASPRLASRLCDGQKADSSTKNKSTIHNVIYHIRVFLFYLYFYSGSRVFYCNLSLDDSTHTHAQNGDARTFTTRYNEPFSPARPPSRPKLYKRCSCKRS